MSMQLSGSRSQRSTGRCRRAAAPYDRNASPARPPSPLPRRPPAAAMPSTAISGRAFRPATLRRSQFRTLSQANTRRAILRRASTARPRWLLALSPVATPSGGPLAQPRRAAVPRGLRRAPGRFPVSRPGEPCRTAPRTARPPARGSTGPASDACLLRLGGDRHRTPSQPRTRSCLVRRVRPARRR